MSSDWQSMCAAPRDGAIIHAETAGGYKLRIKLEWGFIDEDGRDCWSWVAVDENKHPRCWTDGVCWTSNENGDPSDPPIRWRPA